MNRPGERQDVPISDDGRRAADAINVHRVAGAVGRFVAIRLSDGGSDGQAYDTKADAVRHQLHERQCAYVCVPPAPATAAEMTRYLQLHREAYDAGYRFSDPDGPDVMMPTRPGGRGRVAWRIEPNRADRRRTRRGI